VSLVFFGLPIIAARAPGLASCGMSVAPVHAVCALITQPVLWTEHRPIFVVRLDFPRDAVVRDILVSQVFSAIHIDRGVLRLDLGNVVHPSVRARP